MIVIVDSREQQPFTFSAWPDVEVTRATLPELQHFTASVCWWKVLLRT